MGNTKIRMLFSALISIQIYPNYGLDIIETSQGMTCPNDMECAARHSCPHWAEKDIMLSKLENNSDEKRNLIEEYKSAICNKREKGLCCPIESPLDLVEATDKPCPTVSKCATRDSCQFWKQKSDVLGQMRQGTTKYNKLKDELVSEICNKKRKALCCPKIINPINDSPTYLPVEGECGTNPYKSPAKVFGGNTTREGDYPFAVLLGQAVLKRSNNYFGGTRAPARRVPQWVCGGTLINYWYVVTAAHCTAKLAYVRLGEWKVGGFGSDETSSEGLPPVQEFRIRPRNVIVHERYKIKFGQIENDIALIRLPRKPNLNIGVQFACLPLPEAAQQVGLRNWGSELEGKRATVIGWGYSCYEENSRSFCKFDDIGNKEQQYLEVPIVGNEACKDHYTLTEKQVCAGGAVGEGSCRGDSGGGLFIRNKIMGARSEHEIPWYLLGIVSYGQPACGLGVPEVYTKVPKYVGWIKNKISK